MGGASARAVWMQSGGHNGGEFQSLLMSYQISGMAFGCNLLTRMNSRIVGGHTGHIGVAGGYSLVMPANVVCNLLIPEPVKPSAITIVGHATPFAADLD